jgi:hypothetical protein
MIPLLQFTRSNRTPARTVMSAWDQNLLSKTGIIPLSPKTGHPRINEYAPWLAATTAVVSDQKPACSFL